MQKIILSAVFLSMLFSTKAQVLINLQLPQAGLQVKSQLWNMTLINTSTEVLNIKLDMTLIDVTNGQAVLSGSSRLFSLPTGAKQLQLSNLVPIQYNVLNNTYTVNSNPDGFLPVGTFTVCFSILKRNTEVFDKVAEECETIQIEPASPPFLNSPDDQAEIELAQPLFIWLPPTPAHLFNNLSYNLKLVEVNKNQNSSDALQNNLPLLNQSYISNTSFQYPASLQKLDTAKLYAWQVKALNNMLAISNSEIFTFRLKKQNEVSVKEANVYVTLKGLNEVPFAVCSGVLRYEYVNTYNNSIIHFELIDVSSKVNEKIILSEENQIVSYGQNFLQLDFANNKNLKNNHIYQLQVSGAKGEVLAVKFIYNKAN